LRDAVARIADGVAPDTVGAVPAAPRIKNGFPPKICQRCGRPFEWRKKWARDWDNVRYCSEACRKGRNPGN
jgi:hypothetical protein